MKPFSKISLATGTVAILATAVFAGTGTFDIEDGGAAEGNFTASVTPGSGDQALGRVRVSLSNPGSNNMDSVVISLAGARTGLSNFKLWISSDAVLDGGDTQFGSTIASDPGGTNLAFAGLYSDGVPFFYIFLTADLAGGATGTVLPGLEDISGPGVGGLLNFSPGDPMANSAATLPVELDSFSVE